MDNNPGGGTGGDTGLLSRIDKFFSNGTVVALITAALATFFVPRIISRLDKDKQLRAQRLKLATEFLNRNRETQVDLNNFFTTLVLFDKDNTSGLSKTNDYKQEQREMRKQVDALYLKMDQKMWWWYWDLSTQGEISKVVSPSEEPAVRNLNQQYEKNLVDTTGLLNDVWKALLRSNYRPGDPKNAALIDQTKRKLDVLRESRNDLAMKYVEVFAGN